MTEKPAAPPPLMQNPKSDAGLSRSAQALRANLMKRKAQARARAATEPGPETAPEAASAPSAEPKISTKTP
ncbi:MAG: hypothetical protein JNK21_10220 [Rhodospirillaceae bacterium]|nr:hypothetical protein [Rhodospirillaceae bacterium]